VQAQGYSGVMKSFLLLQLQQYFDVAPMGASVERVKDKTSHL
jgi:hypothetical protein